MCTTRSPGAKCARRIVPEITRAFAVPDGLAMKYIQSTKDKEVKENKLAAMLGNSVAYSVSKALMKQAIGMLLVK